MPSMSALRGLLALCLVGCVHPNDDPPSFPEHPHEFDIASRSSLDSENEASLSDLPAPAPRLRRTKTLGQGESTFDRGAVATPAAGPAQNGTTVIVQNNIQQTTSTTVVTPYSVPGLNFAPVYGGPGGASNSRGGAAGGARTGGAPPVGGDWPQVPSYGPR